MLRDSATHSEFIARHIGPSEADQRAMLAAIGTPSLDALIGEVVPENILSEAPYLDLPGPLGEVEALADLKAIAGRNQVLRSYIGQGYYGTYVPHVILRNILENPAWYTAYTPYQPEISQGRLEALLIFQTMITDLTGLDIANSSLLDEATAAAEAMTLARRVSRAKSDRFFVSVHVHPQTLEVLRTRAAGVGIELVVGDEADGLLDCYGVLLQYPHSLGGVADYRALTEQAHAAGAIVAVATDLLALALLAPPGEWGADIAVGSAQRFGVPMGYGGPHAGFMACKDAYKRNLPGRLVGVSQDARGEPALRLALQTREQHIRREKATSNICTAQVLLAVMAAMYAVWHGPQGIARIARRVAAHTGQLAGALRAMGLKVRNDTFFDTLHLETGARTQAVLDAAVDGGMNLRRVDDTHVALSLDETVGAQDIETLAGALAAGMGVARVAPDFSAEPDGIPAALRRQGAILAHPAFSRVKSETDMLRYLRALADKDLALDRTMIPLGSCTMKLNATAEMIPVTWPEFGHMHPFAPAGQAQGYQEMIERLCAALCEITGYDRVSLQPNSGAQGEYAGLLAIRGYHQANGEHQRNVCLIPASAHGTNPASAHLAGMDVVVVASDDNGNIDMADLRAKIAQVGDRLAALMITYPSTHGVFETTVTEICDLIHEAGGQVYLDGANMNAMVGLARPGDIGSDVSHLNLHKTFCIPHGGGGPGMGPIGVKAHLAPFLPKSPVTGEAGAVSAAPFGSASILPISWSYCLMMGGEGLTQATKVAILNANYIAARLKGAYDVLYKSARGRVAHECIIDTRPLAASAGVTVDDVAKRLIDSGFHAPTMSWPVAGTLMIEPTESETKAEIDRFCEAMLAIREEARAIEEGRMDRENNPLKNAPHTVEDLVGDWDRPYSREQACYPPGAFRVDKYWSPVNRVDNVYGDRNLVCSCPPLEDYAEAAE